jgi:streptogramin lyase
MTALIGGAVAAAGCAGDNDPAAQNDQLGEVSLELAAAPSDVQCLRITTTSSTRVDQQLFPLVPGQATRFNVTGLPPGSVTIVANAFPTACSMVTGKSVPNWASDPVPAMLAVGTAPKVFLTLHRNVSAIISADFVGDPTFTEFAIPSGGAPYLITWGFSGDLWFTEREANRVAKITSAGVITEFTVPTANSFPEGISTVGNGEAWFAEVGGNNIGHINTAGVITEFALPTANAQPRGIIAGPDGNFWFTEYAAGKIGRITTAGVITEFTIPSAGSLPVNIDWLTSSPLWFTESGTGKIGAITTAGVITEFTVPSGPGLGRICTGFDGIDFVNMWFVESNADKVANISATGTITEFPLQTNGGAFDINYAFDGNEYVPEPSANLIARVNPVGEVIEFSVPTANAQPFSVAQAGGPNNSIWFTERGAAKIGAMTFP